MRRVMVITGSRSEYGILKPVLNSIQKSPDLELILLVTGMHLSYEFGHTIDEIEKDGFDITHKVDMILSEDSKESMAKSLSIGIMGIVDHISLSKPDVVLVCGDRSEIFGASISAAYLSVPLAHLFGGDMASGSNIDDSIRNSISRFAHIHLTATKEHAERLIKMGEEAWRVHVVGSPAIDTIIHGKKAAPGDLARKYGLDFKDKTLLLVQHPTSFGSESAKNEINQTLQAIVELKHQTIVIYPNIDPGSRGIISTLNEYKKYPFIHFIKSMPHEEYLGVMNVVSALVGNSSSGILEAASFKIPVVNIGDRQKGRLMPENVISVSCDKNEIKRGIEISLNDCEFKAKVQKCENPYGDGTSSLKIVKILSEANLGSELLQKKLTY